jgi:hypothetical protein
MLQEYFMKDSEHTFFGLGDYQERKKREKDAPYDNIFMSSNDGEEFKVNSFTCFQPNENLKSSPVVCPSLLQWAEYLLTPAMETDEQKKERLHKLGEKPMKRYIMTHTTMKSRLTQENTANVVTTSSENTANVDTTTALQQRGNTTTALQQRGNITFLETLAEAITTPNDSAEEEPTSVMLLYRIGEALQAAERIHDSISQKQKKTVGFVNNESKVKGGIASFVQLVQSINEEDNQVDFAAAMEWLERESKTGNSLIIDLTRPGDDNSSSDDSSTSNEHNSDDSDYMEGGGDSKLRHKKRTSHNKQKTPDKGNSPDNGQSNLNILSSVCGDIIIIDEESNDDKEEISVNESNKSNTNIPDDLFHGLYGKSLNNEEVEDEGVKDGQQHQDNSKDGQQHQDNSGGLKEKQVSDQSLQSLTESQQDDMLQIKGTDGKDQPDQDGSGGLEKRQESQQLHSPGKTGEDTMTKSQRKQLRKKERDREKRNRDQEEDQEGYHDSNRNNQEEDSADEVEKRRKKKKKKMEQSSDGI